MNDTMSDQEKPAFHVVDRRKAAQDNPAAETTPTDDISESVSDSKEATSTPSQQIPQETPREETSSDSASTTDNATESSDEGDFGKMPDPTFLLSMAAMQMETRTLLHALLAIFDGHAWRSMGFLADPRTGETRKDLPSAQLAIDTIQFLFGKVEAQLPERERRELQRRLSDLRMNYLAKLREG
jgi:hypothetical protein